MAGLLVSVRSAAEARAAAEGGASIIDVKEPDLGPLGRASASTWRLVQAAVPPGLAVSVALGELRDWSAGGEAVEGLAFRKIGLAGSGRDPTWRLKWAEVRRAEGPGASWVAVAYADWRRAEAPPPDEVLDAAIEADDCSGVLVDTWDKSRPSPLDASPIWREWVRKARRAGQLVALAGGLDAAKIARLAPLEPDWFAVRGAACAGSDRRGVVLAERVAGLALVARIGVSNQSDPS